MIKTIIAAGYRLTPQPAEKTDVQPIFSGMPLQGMGLVMPVTVQTPSVLCAPPRSATVNSMTVVGLLDTGATQTSIDKKLAAALNLEAIGISDHFTAAGPVSNPVYLADMFFPGAELGRFQNLKIGSCMLPFDVNPPGGNLLSIRNIGILIGRDVMSKWNIVWNGPTSTVFISD